MSADAGPAAPPCVLFEDEHLLVVNKPAGVNTHAPAPFAGEGIYDWLRHREPRWAGLAIIHRLDKETSGVLVFGKTPLANRSLTEQFTRRAVRKKYLLLTDRPVPGKPFTVKSNLIRSGEKYASQRGGTSGEAAETRFLVLNSSFILHPSSFSLVEAEPLTGRTHQIRVHAAESGFPILGDTLYGGTGAARVCLHAAELRFKHPATQAEIIFSAPADFTADARLALRAAFIADGEPNACRLIHGAADGWPGWHVERLGDFLLSQGEAELIPKQRQTLEELARSFRARGVYHKILNRQIRRAAAAENSPQFVFGEPAPEAFLIRENGVQFELSFGEGYSVGLFLDQRDNRRRLLTGHIAADFPLLNSKLKTQNSKLEVLNVFAYTCGFSACAARAGARATSLDLSKKYLEWGRRNFALNGLDSAAHDFIFGDAFDWMKRLAKKGRAFDAVILDPPTFSQSKAGGAFRAEKDFGRLVNAALPLVKPGGVLFASTNAAGLPPENFLGTISRAVADTGRKITQQHYAPQPPDFPITRAEPGYLKTVWLRVA
ncbi:MAG: class I SAM-dependent methyltransferase [Verrucomicrobia bacterium]|nr:class I SAM-dependent methyltransferase [Verrucomicrobiota bacterium]